ncbi:MAG: A/G-specific adenine glycosylase [Planctomycetia bacterium]|nr:A/G-specific adenine glycosylase [Planctomycetia bacterium]
MNNSEKQKFRQRLIQWFQKNERLFSWRQTTDPYQIWISEIMLQQTTTQTVEGYFQRFLTRFPTIRILAEADISAVLRIWEGLGYYRRTHQLHQAAKQIVEKHQGIFPNSFQDVLKLPGIGRYTAGAILSFAFDQRLPILEANTLRLHCRILGIEENPTSKKINNILWDFAEKILPQSNCGQFNQSLMDLGSLVCLPQKPKCRECPVVSFCLAAQNGTQHFIPNLVKKKEKEARNEVAVLVRQSDLNEKSHLNRKAIKKKQTVNRSCSKEKNDHSALLTFQREDKFLLVQYPSHVRWGGLWDFPRFLQKNDQEPSNDLTINKNLRLLLNRPTIQVQSVLKTIHHVVTKYKITLRFCDSCLITPALMKNDKKAKTIKSNHFDIEFASGTVSTESLSYAWVSLNETENYPLSSTGRKLVDFLKKQFAK